MDFQVKLGFPTLAKIALGDVVALLLAIVSLVLFFVNRKRKGEIIPLLKEKSNG